MKTKTHVLLAVGLIFNPVATQVLAALGEAGGGISSRPFGTAGRLFAEHSVFSAAYEIQTRTTSSIPVVSMSGTVACLDGKWRLQIHMGQALTNQTSIGPFPNDLKVLGGDLDSLTNLTATLIWRPDKKVIWRTYSFPGVPVEGYFEEQLEDSGGTLTEVTKEAAHLAEQAVEGHPAVLNRFIVTDPNGKVQRYMVWNATDLKRFPVRIEWTERNTTNVMLFKDVRLDKPDNALFEAPASKRYSAVALMLDVLKALREKRGTPVVR